MKTIEKQFRQDGYLMSQEKREGLLCLYSKVKPGDFTMSWEVVILSENPPFEIKGIQMGDSESYPRSEKWGEKGWSYSDREDAIAKFNSLLPK